MVIPSPPLSETTSIWSSKLNPKVAIVVNSLRGGGAENSMAALNQNLNFRQYRARLIGINSCALEVHPKALENEIEIGRTHLAKFCKTLESFVLFRKTIKDFNPDILIANCDLPELFSAMLLGKYKIIVVEHSSVPWAGRRAFGVMVRWMLKLTGASFVSISNKIKVWRGPVESYTVLENLIPRQGLSAKQSKNRLEPRLIFIGRLENQKCPEMFVQVQSKLNIPALVIGDGRLRKDLEQFSVENNLDIDFKGFQQNPWIFVRQEDYLVVTSVFEGKPLVILEALSLGIKIFARDIPELHEEFQNSAIVFCASLDDFVRKITLEQRLYDSGTENRSSIEFDLEKHNGQAINAWTEYLNKALINLD